MDKNQMTAVRRCACASIRRVDRTLTQFFDEALAPCKLHTTQFTLLAAIAEAQQATIQHLAKIIVMDRTTLTRNLEPLLEQGLISIQRGEDRRSRVVQLTSAGRETLEKAFPYWQKAQNQVLQMLGEERFGYLLAELSNIVALFSS